MPARIEGEMLRFLARTLNVQVWQGETPRYDPFGLPINPDTLTIPPSFPVIHCELPDGGGFDRSDTTEDPFTDKGEVVVRCWANTLEDVSALLDKVEAQLRLLESWQTISKALGAPAYGDPSNPYAVVQVLEKRWWRGQDKGVRDNQNRLVFRGEFTYEVELHGALPTQNEESIIASNIRNLVAKS